MVWSYFHSGQGETSQSSVNIDSKELKDGDNWILITHWDLSSSGVNTQILSQITYSWYCQMLADPEDSNHQCPLWAGNPKTKFVIFKHVLPPLWLK